MFEAEANERGTVAWIINRREAAGKGGGGREKEERKREWGKERKDVEGGKG